MKRYFKLIMLGLSVILSLSLLTGCNTVKGTVHGAGQDLDAVGDAINPPPHHRTVQSTTTTKTYQKQYSAKKPHHRVTTHSQYQNQNQYPQQAY